MKLEAMKHQGKHIDSVTSAQVGPKCDTDGNGRADNLGNRANEVVEEHSMIFICKYCSDCRHKTMAEIKSD